MLRWTRRSHRLNRKEGGMRHKRTRYQQGSLTTEARRKGPDVWIYRWRERCAGRTVNRKAVLGTVKELTKSQAQRKAAE